MTDRDTFLIVGGDSVIGLALKQRLERLNCTVLATTRRKEAVSEGRIFLDLNGDVSSWQCPRKISVAFLCAAVTSLEVCRKNPIGSAHVNVGNTVSVARQLIKEGTFIVFLSTNLVFSGENPRETAKAPYRPRTEYGRQKMEAECQLLQLGNQVSIVRLSKVIGLDQPLLTVWRRSLVNGEIIHPFSDMVMAPVTSQHAVEVIYRVGEAKREGVFQVSADRDISYAEAAIRLAQGLGASVNQIQPILSKDSGLYIENVVKHTTLDTERVETELEIPTPSAWTPIDNCRN